MSKGSSASLTSYSNLFKSFKTFNRFAPFKSLTGFQNTGRGTSTFREFSKRRNEIYFLRFFNRVLSSFIDIVGSRLLSSISFQNLDEA
jgi:hypothetical protein